MEKEVEKKEVEKEVEKKEVEREESDVCPECGSPRLIRDYKRGELVCQDCGCVIEDKYIDAGPEWRAFDSEQKEKRSRVGAPVTYSVDADESIIVKINGEIKIVKIGELIDSLIEKKAKEGKVRKEGILEIADVSDEDLEVVAFDENYKFAFKKVSEVSRHPVNEVFEVVVEGGKSIKVTGSHSVFTVVDSEVVPIRADQLKKGDFLVLARKLPNTEELIGLIGLAKITKGMYTQYNCLFTSKNWKGEVSLSYMLKDGSKVLNYEPLHVIESNLLSEHFQASDIATCNGVGITPEVNLNDVFNMTETNAIAKLKMMAKVLREKKEPPVEELVPAPDKYAKEWKCGKRARISRSLALKIAEKYGDEKLKRLAESDFMFLRVKAIRKVKPTNGYAYDLTVPQAENFVAGMGFVLHNTIHDKGLTTIIDWSNKDFYGKSISVKNRAQLFRLRKWQRRIRISNATERNLAFALSELDRMASALGLPKPVRETAAVIYRKAVDKNLIRGRSIEGVVAAALYAACRQVSVPRTLDEIASYSRVDRKEIGRTYRFIARELGLKLMPTNPADYVPRFCTTLKLSGEVQKKAIEIIKKAEEKELTSGRGPTGVAAAAIYIASILSGERRTQREVAEVAGVTEVTIRNRYKELAEKLGIEIIL